MSKSEELNSSLLILVNKGKILLQHRTLDAPRYPGYWSFFGGKIEQGESPEEAIIREIKEELDLIVTSPKLFLEESYEDHDEGSFGKRYYFILDYNNETLSLNEGQGMDWFRPKVETDSLKIRDLNRKVIDRLFLEI